MLQISTNYRHLQLIRSYLPPLKVSLRTLADNLSEMENQINDWAKDRLGKRTQLGELYEKTLRGENPEERNALAPAVRLDNKITGRHTKLAGSLSALRAATDDLRRDLGKLALDCLSLSGRLDQLADYFRSAEDVELNFPQSFDPDRLQMLRYFDRQSAFDLTPGNLSMSRFILSLRNQPRPLKGGAIDEI